MAEGDPASELQALARQVAALQARVEEIASRGGPTTTAPAPADVAPAPQPETAAEGPEEADVARVAPKPGEMVGIGEGSEGRTVTRRVPVSSLRGGGRSIVPLGYDVGMYLTRFMHRAARAESGGGMRESYTGSGDGPLSLSGDAGLLATETATDGAPPRIVLHAMPFPRLEQAATAEDISALQKYAAEAAANLEPLASAPRLAILLLLRRAARSSTDLQQGLGLAPGQMYHHLKPLAAAGFLRRDADGRYAISGRGRRALLAAQLLSAEISSGRFQETLERASESAGDTRFQVFAGERSTDVPLDEDARSAGGGR